MTQSTCMGRVYSLCTPLLSSYLQVALQFPPECFSSALSGCVGPPDEQGFDVSVMQCDESDHDHTDWLRV